MNEFERTLVLQFKEVNKSLATMCDTLNSIDKRLDLIDDSIRFLSEELTHKNGIVVPKTKEEEILKKKDKNV